MSPASGEIGRAELAMLGLYVVALIVGGSLILMSVFGAFHGHDADFAGGDTDAHLEADQGGDTGHESWIPFLSLRFWTYFFAVGGASGLLLSYFGGIAEPAVGVVSVAAGLLVGLIVAYTMRLITGANVDSSMRERDLLGQSAKALVASRDGMPGRVRCEVKGEVIDLLAIAESGEEFAAGADLVVVAFENGTAKVVTRDSIFGDS